MAYWTQVLIFIQHKGWHKRGCSFRKSQQGSAIFINFFKEQRAKSIYRDYVKLKLVNLLLGGCLFPNHTCIMETTGFNVGQAYTLNGHIFHWLAARGNTNYPCFFAFCRWGCITRQIKWVEHCVQKCYKKQVWNKNMRIGIYIDAYRRQGLTYPGFLNLEM